MSKNKRKKAAHDNQDNVVMLFYRQVVALDAGRHGGLKLGAAPGHGFASNTNAVPLAGVEFAEAVKEYPVVFTRDAAGAVGAVAVLGLELNENVFLGGQADWQAHYLPAFVRRYPFILAANPGNPGEPWVCLDESCAWLGPLTGEPLFADGQPSDYLRQIIAFLADYNTQLERTAIFGRKLSDWGLLTEGQAQASTADGQVHTLAGILTVDENALRQLAADKILELFKTGELAWIYFHLASLGNFRLLAERKSARAI